MTLVREAWDTLRSVAALIDRVGALSGEIAFLRTENRELRDRLVRLETIIEEARHRATLERQPRRLPPTES